jgi:hypothetical protein
MAEFSPAFQGRGQAATAENMTQSSLTRRDSDSYSIPALKGRAKFTRRLHDEADEKT